MGFLKLSLLVLFINKSIQFNGATVLGPGAGDSKRIKTSLPGLVE
jgi:hypothetical protein